MSKLVKIFFSLLIFSPLTVAQSYLIIQGGNSIFVPAGCQLCLNNIVVEEGAYFITEDTIGICKNVVVKKLGKLSHSELISFTANLDENKNVLLKWEVANETDNFGFNIERSKSGNLGFEKIGFVTGQGNSSSKKSYYFIDKLPQSDINYDYRLTQINSSNNFQILKTIGIKVPSPENYSLSQNYPNPFNPSTKIHYSIPHIETAPSQHVILKVFDILGNEIETLVNEEKPAGNYEVTLNASNLSSGIYFCRMQAGNYTQTRKMILLR